MTEKEKMLSGELYTSRNPELQQDNLKCKKLTRLFNQTTEEESERRDKLLRELFGKVGKHIFIEPPLHCDYGCNVFIGDNFFANYDCIILDTCKVKIGNNVFFGPKVCVYAASHPIDAQVRAEILEIGKPVTIGDNVWIGGNAVINPGVVIGNNSIIGSGSVVTKNIPENVIAAGNPCKVLRNITDEDKKYWQEKRKKWLKDAGGTE
jgi:maltose O-acetyltransferase